MPSERIEKIRQLGAKYWQPVISMVAVIFSALKAVNDLPEGLNVPRTWIWIASGIFVVIAVRFPRVVFWVTRLILGKPKPLSDEVRIFRGPRPYLSEDKDVFYGRKKEVDDCKEIIRQHAFLLIDGESGCGKSSFLNAGLLIEAEKEFKVIKCRIADDPFGKLRSALLAEPYRRSEESRGEGALTRALTTATKPHSNDSTGGPQNNKPLLVCIDQFEELFTTVKDESRIQFLKALKRAIKDGKLRLILAMRSDFLDLLLKACRIVDPDAQAFDLGNYYTLEAFRKDEAEEVLEKMLEPAHKNESLLKQEVDLFRIALVDEMLRPPRDKRLYKDDEKTVLPVELQTVGMMMESVGTGYFSREGLKRLGGKIGLFKTYIEDAKKYVWLKTAVPGEKSLLILRQLISPARTKWAKTPSYIAGIVGMPAERVEKVLKAYSEKYLVKAVVSEDEVTTEGSETKPSQD